MQGKWPAARVMREFHESGLTNIINIVFLMKQHLSTISVAMLAAMAALQAHAAVPSVDDIVGNYVQCDSLLQQDETSGEVYSQFNKCTDLTVAKVEGADDKVTVSGFWRGLRGDRYTLTADFDDFNGSISLPAGTVIWEDNRYNGSGELIGTVPVMAYAMEGSDEAGWQVSSRPIIFSYDQSTGRYVNRGYIAISTYVADESSDDQTEGIMEYLYNVTFVPANGMVTNSNYRVESDGTISQSGEESRACYVDEKTGEILNLLYTDQYNTGPLMNFSIKGNSFILPAAPIAAFTDATYSYKVLAGVDIDPETKKPWLTQTMEISGEIVEDGATGEKSVSFSPSAIYAVAVVADETTGQYYMDISDNSPVFEIVESLELKYTPVDVAASVGDAMASDAVKEVATVEYYDLYGRKLPAAADVKGVVIKRITYTDGSMETVKEIN